MTTAKHYIKNGVHWESNLPPRGTFLCPRGHLFMPRGHCLATKGHLFVPWGQLFVLLICYTKIKSSPHFNIFFLKCSKITNSMMITNLMNYKMMV